MCCASKTCSKQSQRTPLQQANSLQSAFIWGQGLENADYRGCTLNGMSWKLNTSWRVTFPAFVLLLSPSFPFFLHVSSLSSSLQYSSLPALTTFFLITLLSPHFPLFSSFVHSAISQVTWSVYCEFEVSDLAGLGFSLVPTGGGGGGKQGGQWW